MKTIFVRERRGRERDGNIDGKIEGKREIMVKSLATVK